VPISPCGSKAARLVRSSSRFVSLAAFAAAALASLGFAGRAQANNVTGAWDPTVYSWPLIPVHAVVLPDMRIMTYGTDGTGRQTGYFVYDVWDINAGLNGGHLTLPNTTGTDIFCGSQLVLPDAGAVFLAGGDNWTGTATTNTGNNKISIFDIAGNSLTSNETINRPRWYSSSTALLNGEVYIQGGSGGTDRPEVRQVNGSMRLLTGANTSSLDFMYPRNFIAPDGRVFGYDSNGRMFYVNPTGTGSITTLGQLPTGNRGNDASAAMFRPGRILQMGGSSSGAVVIDITSGSPVVTATQSMSSQRRLLNATILPNGRVLATGGSQVWNQLTGVNNSAEIWNPTTGQWTRGPDGQRARLYHSISVLLPDGRVLVGGGGAPGPQNNLNVEVYNPPYLYDTNGLRAVQARITSVPGSVDIGDTFTADFVDANDISRVTMVKAASVTHSFNMEQRFVELTFTRVAQRLRIQAPTRAADAPPGYWWLFLHNESGVPSIAKLVKINVAPNWNPALVPTLTNPGAQSGRRTIATSLQLAATDPNGDELVFGASGLPNGLTLNPATGLISGTPTVVGEFNVVVTASDGVNTTSQSFVWTIADATLVLIPPPPPAPLVHGSAVTFTASSQNGVNTQYSWQFDDGTPNTAWSSNPGATHTFSRPGIYYVTVFAKDDTGQQRVETITQTVYLPATANRPASSSNLAIAPNGGGNARLWVVNQDNDSVSIFDTVTRAKLSEVNVGIAPRAIAVAPDGRIWVTNKLSSSITILNPGTFAVAQTVALPRASQPFGIAFAPTGGFAFVALEGTGQLLKLNASTGATVSTLAVGANPRHVSVTSDGGTVYVSRFVTPLLPGESTAVINTDTAGGEVVQVLASAMTVARTIVLAHSDAPDFENQGRGVPNYLGAAVISPDGTQAWVPSKQDNVLRGTLRDGLNLSFQNTVRAISSRIDVANGVEDLGARIDHDNASVASAAVFDPRGVYMFVALETSREVAVVDAHGKLELFRFDAGRAPQGLALSSDGNTLFVSNFMDRTIGVFNLSPLLNTGIADVPAIASLNSVNTEKLNSQVLLGKQLFYDARDARLARDRYISCASCHNDGGQDGRVWDLTGMGEGLRNTTSLRGRAAAHGFSHWSGNFDEIQDFEGQIRQLAGGTGLMSDADFNAGTRSQPLGDTKAGRSADLDALAAYVASLNAFDNSPLRNADGSLTASGAAGKTIFESSGCTSCHGTTKFSNSGAATLFNIGTIKPASGKRLGAALTGIDPPTLRDVWATAPYLHDGSAATLADAVRAHSGVALSDTAVNQVVAYLGQIGAEENPTPPAATYTIWQNQTPSAGFTDIDAGSIELGTRFRTSTAGTVTGIRFYKVAGNGGTHVGSLWTSTGTLLGRVTFSGETASGWQVASLPTPVTLAANTWYVVSYLTNGGRYVGQDGGFASAGITNGPLYAARDGDAGSNGLYRYTSTSAFPNETYLSEAYWVDVTFLGEVIPDTASPTVAITSPTSAASYTATTGTIALGGTATDNTSVSQVTWSNDRGGSGTATGTATWSVAAVTLQPGTNVITVTARDAAGNVGTDILTTGYNPDLTAPVVSGRSPAIGASGIAATSPVTVVFSEALNASTVNTTTLQLKNPGGNVVTSTVTFNAATLTATLTPSAALTPGVVYTMTVRGGATGVKDLAGNALATDETWSFTTAPDNTVPGVTITAPTNASTYTATGALLNIGGTASDNVAVTEVTWTNDRGGSGTATGTVSWNVTGVPIVAGTNIITVTARDAAGNTSADTLSVSFAPDVTAPTVAERTPASGATGVARATAVTARFSEALDPSTVSTSTFELRTSGGTLVPATVSYNTSTFTATLTPSATLGATTTYTATLKSGATDPRIRDVAGNALAGDVSWSFTTTASSCPCTIWGTQVPANAHIDIDGSGKIELGTRFRASANGRVTGIRFYKHAGNTGTHVGSLWSSTGTLLGRVTFSGESASGWQTATLATPVSLTANTWYVVSYGTGAGQYIGQDGAFASAGITNGPLYAARDGDGGANGVYRYTTSNAFPNQTYLSEGYWVDVVFTD
jgi:YVTN family beta-propeller protein